MNITINGVAVDVPDGWKCWPCSDEWSGRDKSRCSLCAGTYLNEAGRDGLLARFGVGSWVDDGHNDGGRMRVIGGDTAAWSGPDGEDGWEAGSMFRRAPLPFYHEGPEAGPRGRLLADSVLIHALLAEGASVDPLASRAWLTAWANHATADERWCVIEWADVPEATEILPVIAAKLDTLTDDERGRILREGGGEFYGADSNAGASWEAPTFDAAAQMGSGWWLQLYGTGSAGTAVATRREAEERALVHTLSQPDTTRAFIGNETADIPTASLADTLTTSHTSRYRASVSDAWAWARIGDTPTADLQPEAMEAGRVSVVRGMPDGTFVVKDASGAYHMGVDYGTAQPEHLSPSDYRSQLSDDQRRYLIDTEAPPAKGVGEYGIRREAEYDPGPPCEAVLAELRKGITEEGER